MVNVTALCSVNSFERLISSSFFLAASSSAFLRASSSCCCSSRELSSSSGSLFHQSEIVPKMRFRPRLFLFRLFCSRFFLFDLEGLGSLGGSKLV